MPTDNDYLDQTLVLAQQGRYTTHPNPRVGCVLVKDQQIIATGYHQIAGGPHAEINALKTAGKAAQGATCYVSLEPCSHTGRTGPCTQALIDAGVRRVVFGALDPNPQVAGQGVAALKAAGITVDGPFCQAAVCAQNPGFFKRFNQQKPWLRLKVAMSLDNKIALSSGASQWITGAAARERVHHWRAQSDAILTSVNTITQDDPQMTVRHSDLPDNFKQPLCVILDSTLKTPPTAQIFNTNRPVIIYTLNDNPEKIAALAAAGAEVVAQPAATILSFDFIFTDLAHRQINEVWCEAGQRLTTALLEAGCVDELLVHLAPKMLGANALSAFAMPDITDLAQAPAFKLQSLQAFGNDVEVVYSFA